MTNTHLGLMHESGTGGFPKYGIVGQMPLTTLDGVNVLDNTTYWQPRRGNDSASVGYFRTSLQNGVTAGLSASRHAGIMHYSFPGGEKHVLVDLSHYLPSETGGYSVQVWLGGEVIPNTNGSNQYTGSATFGGGWNEGAPYTVYFCGDFNHPPDQTRTFRGRNTEPMQRYHTYSDQAPPQAIFADGPQQSGPLNDRVGVVFSWNSSEAAEITSRVGLSFISSAKACSFKEQEIPSWDLESTVAAAKSEWNDNVFSRIQVDASAAANQTNLALLYSSLYFMHLMPSDRTGENPLWESGEPSWDDFYTLWDIFRCTVSLYHLLQPTYYESMIRSLIDIWRVSVQIGPSTLDLNAQHVKV
jgi:putative alpha-1,2-mannosidase